MQLLYRIGTLALIALLVACGGKGDDDAAVPPAAAVGPVASTLGFPLRAAHAALVLLGQPTATLWARGSEQTASVNGLCSGTLALSAAPINFPQVFEGVRRQFAINAAQAAYTNCPLGNTNEYTVVYYDDNYLPLGSVGPGSYSVWPTPAVYPVTVTVGMSGTIGTEQLYTDSTRNTSLGRVDYSYVVEPDTATSAIVNVVAQHFDAANQLQYTVQQRRRIKQDTLYSMVSWERQDAAPSNLRLIFRR